MTRQVPKTTTEPTVTLTDADIKTTRVTRRTLLGSLGLGAGVAATTIFGVSESAPAADADAPKKKVPPKKTTKKPPPKKPAPKEETDSD